MTQKQLLDAALYELQIADEIIKAARATMDQSQRVTWGQRCRRITGSDTDPMRGRERTALLQALANL
ncbi:hypothetical protein FMZ60_09070 [Alcaligenaceae bacterium SJ-26]|nr:hypothetical protein FMZ60_09070 [Alcaligenaceae bacterium SJ-26]